MKCPHCASEIPIHQQYCAFCGKKVEVDFSVIAASVHEDAEKATERKLAHSLQPAIAFVIFLNVAVLVFTAYITAPVRIEPLPIAGVVPPAPKFSQQIKAALPEIPGSPQRLLLELPQAPVRGVERFGFRKDPVRSALHAARGGSPEALQAIRKGLECLVSRQERSGAWAVGSSWSAGRASWGDVGVTGLAVLALLGDGHVWTAGDDALGQAAGRAVRYLLASQQASGLIGPESGHYMYNHGIATAALCEAYAMSGLEALREPAERAVAFLIAAQRPSGGWDYFAKETARADVSVSAWQVAALYSAGLAGIDPRAEGRPTRDEALRSAANFLDSYTHPGTYETGYDRRPEPGAKIAHPTLGPTAIALACRAAIGQDPASLVYRKQAEILLRPENLPRWKKEWGTGPAITEPNAYYYWYHGTMAMRHIGGERWKLWNEAVTKTLLGSQEQDGSWPKIGQWAADGGRAYTTALAILTLEATYRYP